MSAESDDLAKLKEDCAKERELFFSMVREIIRADDATLQSMGLRTKGKAQGVYDYAQDTLKRIDKIHAAYIKKYPD